MPIRHGDKALKNASDVMASTLIKIRPVYSREHGPVDLKAF